MLLTEQTLPKNGSAKELLSMNVFEKYNFLITMWKTLSAFGTQNLFFTPSEEKQGVVGRHAYGQTSLITFGSVNAFCGCLYLVFK